MELRFRVDRYGLALTWGRASTAAAPEPAGGLTVDAPAAGAWWPAVRVGHPVRADQVIGTLVTSSERAEVESRVSGRVAELLTPHGAAVESGAPLLRLAPGPDPTAP